MSIKKLMNLRLQLFTNGKFFIFTTAAKSGDRKVFLIYAHETMIFLKCWWFRIFIFVSHHKLGQLRYSASPFFAFISISMIVHTGLHIVKMNGIIMIIFLLFELAKWRQKQKNHSNRLQCKFPLFPLLTSQVSPKWSLEIIRLVKIIKICWEWTLFLNWLMNAFSF